MSTYNSKMSEISSRSTSRRNYNNTNKEIFSKKKEFTPAQPITHPSRENESVAPPFTVPVVLVLLGECALVAAVFVVLITVVSIRMTSTMKNLVEQRIAADLRYSQTSILNPIDSAEQLAKGHRLRYLSETARNNGKEPCNEHSHEWSDSVGFLSDGMSTVFSHDPIVGWVYIVGFSSFYTHPTTGDRQVYECGLSPEYIFIDNRGVSRYSEGPVSPDQSVDFSNVSYYDDDTDTRYDGYIFTAEALTRFGWAPHVYVDIISGHADLLLGSFCPMLMNRTYANGTVETFVATLEDDEPLDKGDGSTLSVVTSFALDIRLPHVNNLIKEITPQTEGAHSSLYDLAGNQLIATSADIILSDEDDEMWPLGESPSEALNEAFATLNPQRGVVGDSAVRIEYHGDHILSSIAIVTKSEVDFVIIQSTPVNYYLQPVKDLRTLMIALGVVAAVVVVVVCVAVIAAIRVSLAEIQEGMLLAAHLKNDKVRPVRSVMTEIDNLCLAFAQMNAKLGAARAFMPQSMLMSSDDSDLTDGLDDDDDDDDGSRKVKDRKSRRSDDDASSARSPATATASTLWMDGSNRSASGRGAGGGDDSTIDTNNNTTVTGTTANTATGHAAKRVGTGSSSNNKKGTPANLLLPISGRGAGSANNNITMSAMAQQQQPCSLQAKRVTILCINTRGFDKITNTATMTGVRGGGGGGGPLSASAYARDLTQIVQSAALKRRGVIDAFHGDHFVVGFNAAKHNAQGPRQAVHCALDIILMSAANQQQQQQRQANQSSSNGRSGLGISGGGNSPAALLAVATGVGDAEAPSQQAPSVDVPLFSMGVSSGRALVGHMGSNDLKRFSIVGKAYGRALALERVCKSIGDAMEDECFASPSSTPPAPSSANRVAPAILVDASVASEVEYHFLLQALAMGREVGEWQPAASDNLKREKAQCNNNKSHPPTTTGIMMNKKRRHVSLTELYAVRAALLQSAGARSSGGGGDEWLYEMEDVRKRRNTVLTDVNKAMVAYLRALWSAGQPQEGAEEESAAKGEVDDSNKPVFSGGDKTHQSQGRSADGGTDATLLLRAALSEALSEIARRLAEDEKENASRQPRHAPTVVLMRDDDATHKEGGGMEDEAVTANIVYSSDDEDDDGDDESLHVAFWARVALAEAQTVAAPLNTSSNTRRPTAYTL